MAADSLPPPASTSHPETEAEDNLNSDQTVSPKKPGVKRYVFAGLAVIALLAGIWKGYDWWTVGRYEIRTDNAYIRANISLISPKVQGYVESISVEDNQTVKAGDLLFTLESSDYAARLAEAKAALAQAEAGVAQAQAELSARRSLLLTAQAQFSSQNSTLKEARATIDVASAKAQQAEADLQRDSGLADSGYYPKARLQTEGSNVLAAKAELRRAEAAAVTQQSQISLARSSIDRASEDISAAEAAVTSMQAKVEAAKARVDAAQLDAGRAEVRSPIAGVVANRMIAQGQLMNPGQQALSIVPVHESYVVANFKETQVERMRPGQKVELTFDAYSDIKAEGRVESLAPASGSQFSLIPQDTATGNFTKIVQRVPVRIAISDEALATGLMRPGLSVEAVVTVKPDN